jgi:hypothetical protein
MCKSVQLCVHDTLYTRSVLYFFVITAFCLRCLPIKDLLKPTAGVYPKQIYSWYVNVSIKMTVTVLLKHGMWKHRDKHFCIWLLQYSSISTYKSVFWIAFFLTSYVVCFKVRGDMGYVTHQLHWLYSQIIYSYLKAVLAAVEIWYRRYGHVTTRSFEPLPLYIFSIGTSKNSLLDFLTLVFVHLGTKHHL